MQSLLPILSGALGLGLLIGGVVFTGRKVKGADYTKMDKDLAGARRTIDSLYTYIHRWRRWVFSTYPDAEIPVDLLTVPEDESRKT